MKISYIFHSCYIVETKKATYVFDYYDGDVKELSVDKPIYFFASHGHFDHCSKKVFELGKKAKEKKYIFAEDIQIQAPSTADVMYIRENESYRLDDIIFHTFHSTDLGVAYLIETDEGVIYHAGDLNWWHWNGEEKAYNIQMAEDFKKEVAKISQLNKTIEVAFLPLDQRQEDAYDWGMKYFMQHTKTKRVMPMHFFSENFDICKKVLKENNQFKEYTSEFIAIERLNQVFEI